MNRSNTIRNANAMTGINEYWMNALNQDQNSQSSFGTMKNGTKIGPTNAHTALAISPKATIAAIDPAMLYLASRYLLGGIVFFFIGLETKNRLIERIDAELEAMKAALTAQHRARAN